MKYECQLVFNEYVIRSYIFGKGKKVYIEQSNARRKYRRTEEKTHCIK